MRILFSTLLWTTAIGCGCIGGVYFAFSSFIMPALERAGVVSGATAMNSINVTILSSAFMALFWVTTLGALVLAGLSVPQWRDPRALIVLAGGIVYVAGMFGSTVLFNVPLNNALAAVDPATVQGSDVWARYLRDWTFWNHIRTIASLLAGILFTIALTSARANSVP